MQLHPPRKGMDQTWGTYHRTQVLLEQWQYGALKRIAEGEIVTLTQARLGHRTALLVGKTPLDQKLVTLLHITPSDEKASWKLFEKRADKSCSFTDCTSFIVMRRQKVKMAPTFDHHFAQEGFHVAPE